MATFSRSSNICFHRLPRPVATYSIYVTPYVPGVPDRDVPPPPRKSTSEGGGPPSDEPEPEEPIVRFHFGGEPTPGPPPVEVEPEKASTKSTSKIEAEIVNLTRQISDKKEGWLKELNDATKLQNQITFAFTATQVNHMTNRTGKQKYLTKLARKGG